MYTQESTELCEAFSDLKAAFTLDSVRTFLKSCWLISDTQSVSENSFERLIYTEGDPNEIYSRREREIINSVTQKVFIWKNALITESGSAESRIIAVAINSCSNSIFDAIAIMKIVNKAFDGFNVFLIVTPSGVHLGCNLLSSIDDLHDCIVTPLLAPPINWEFLCENFIYRNDSNQLYEYYSGIVTTISGITPYSTEYDHDHFAYYSYFFDEDYFEDTRNFHFDDYFNRSSYEVDDDSEFDIDRFDREVTGCLFDLSYIKKAHTNPLEMLFEAERTYALSEQRSKSVEEGEVLSEENDTSDIDLLDDPIALMKKLKKDRGL